MSDSVHLRPLRSLTPAQELIWTSQRLQPDSPHQNMALLTTFGAPIDAARFLAAVDDVVATSDALRTTIREIDGIPHPVVSAEIPSPCKVVRVDRDQLDEWMQQRLAKPIDLTSSAYEAVLIDLGNSEWAWWVNVHHIVIDAASSANFFRAVADRYFGVGEAGASYADVWAEMAAAQESPRYQKALDHWGLVTEPSPTMFYRPDSGPTSLAERVLIDMASGRQESLDALLAERFRLLSPDLSLMVALATALAAYLARLGNDSITIGVPIHHRSSKAAKQVIGPLVELFPLPIEVEDGDTFASLHKRLGRGVFDLLRHAMPGTSPRQSFDVVLNVHGATLGDFGDIAASTKWIHPGHVDPHHRLRIQALDYDGKGMLELALDVNHRIADSDHRRRAVDHFSAMLDAMIGDPDSPVHSIQLLSEDERLLVEPFSKRDSGVPLDGTAPDIVADRLRSHGWRTTIEYSDADTQIQVTAEELNQRIETVSQQLRRAGFGRGDLVGIEMPIGIEAVVAIHGVQRSGAAFVPIDPEYPEARREHIRTDSGCELVIRGLDDLEKLEISEPAPAHVPIDPDDLAYVIYTSGSTGLPKGVPITHRGLSEYLGFAYSAYVGGSPPVMPLFTSLSFDLTITTLYLPLLSGGVMTIHPDGGLPALRDIVEQSRATLIKATPSHLELLVRMIDSDHPLERLIVGGEAFMTDLADRLIDRCHDGLEIFNEYGPTEAVVGCMKHRYDRAGDPGPEVPIGHPAPGVGLRVLDRFGYPVPLGVTGELYISRAGMTSGYLGRSDLTAEKLVTIETSGSTEVMYRTGDLVRMLDADRMVYLGRIDEQIKVGGIRLEPGEIEHIAKAVPGVTRVVAGLWSPDSNSAVEHCVRCGLGSDVPDVTIDGDGVCSSCHRFDLVAPQAASWFKTEDDLVAAIADARERSTSDYDVIHLISGGKDSTYALYKLVELGARVFAITLDNGYIAEVAKANVRRATSALGVDHEFVTVAGMDEIFKDSLDRFSNVCNGCYKAIYTIALAKAEDLGIAAIVTGLSRGQFFETRLVPGMFESDRFDPDAIDAMVREARHVYHTTPDAVSEHMDVAFLADETIFDRISFIDFYRYVDVELSELYRTLDNSGTWRRPPDSGRSTNCLINAAGIFVHKIEQGHHNYAAPYSWDVRLGHKTRDEALFELDDPMNDDELTAITTMLAEVGYEPRKPEMLTLWVEATNELDLEELRAELADRLPSHAVPHAIEVVGSIPLTRNGKVDVGALPAPAFRRTVSDKNGRAPVSDTELEIASIWGTVLGIADVGATDDFFALGGTSLHALEMIVRVSDHFDVAIAESLAFTKRTVEELSVHVDTAVDAAIDGADGATSARVELAIPSLPDDAMPLSAGEESMLYEWRRDPADLRYNVARLYLLPNNIDLERLDEAVRLVVAHQPTLHTSYGPRRQKLDVDSALWIGRESSEIAPLLALAENMNATQFDLINGRLMSLHHLSSDHPKDRGQAAVLLRTHHIVSDAGSLDVLWHQIDLAYRGQDLPLLETSYAEHAMWQRNRTADPSEVWNPRSAPGELLLRGVGAEPDGYVHQRSSITMSELRSAPATTPFATALTALAATMAPYHDASTFELTITSSVRDHPSIADVVGYFLNPLPLLIDVDPDQTLQSLADSVSETLAGRLEHRAVPFGAIVRSARERCLALPTGRVMLAVEDLADAALDGALVDHTILSSGTAVNDLTFFVQIRGERIELGCEYRGDTIGRASAERLLTGFGEMLAALVGSSHDTVETYARRPEPLAGAAVDELGEYVPTLLSEAAQQWPDASAVLCGDRSMSYSEVEESARSIAARLRAVGVNANDRVAIVLPRSAELIPAIWATWMLGASYVPIDISQPAARVTELISAAEVRAAVTSGDGHAGLHEVTTIHVDRDDRGVLPITRSHPIDDRTEAYVIFTSGSTGRPKGVPISHRNLRASLSARRQWYPDPVERYLLVSSAGFDSSVAGIFWSLADGGELVIPTEDQVHDVDALAGLIGRAGVTHTLMVPSLYGAILDRSPESLTSLRTVIVAGEAFPPPLVSSHFASLSTTELVNEYGPTEATVWSTAHRCTAEDGLASTVPIGHPIPGVSIEVVGPNGMARPIDTAGELRVSGDGVAHGYLSGADSSSFVEGRGAATYATGDLVIRRGDGTLDFVGRVDAQLSVGGVRIEPAEIEQALTSLDGVHAALVGLRGRNMVAWIEAPAADPGQVRSSIGKVLPATHVPSRIVIIDALPRNANGKLDRARLSELTIDTLVVDVSSAETTVNDPIVSSIVSTFAAAFEGEVEVSPTSDFFDLGGDSLRAVAVVSMLENNFGRRVAIGELIDAPTPILLAARLSDHPADPSSAESAEQTTVANGLVEWLRSSGSQTPLIVLPPGGGNLLRYAPLVRALDSDIPVVGVRLPGADARSEVVDSISAQAETMLASLDEAQIVAPYRLLGWSTGGLLAWEIARKLQARGDKVELVALVDTVMAGLKVDDSGSIGAKYRYMFRSDGVKAVATEGVRRVFERASFAIARRRYRAARDAGRTPSFEDAERQLGPVIRRAALQFKPRPLDLPVVYIAASESDDAVTLDPWAELQSGYPFEVIEIEGVHFLPEDRCVIGQNKAPTLVEKLGQHLDQEL
ncbi:MAG: amino acid adenylation domain-containing protein [Verrucomicrobiales bacterium]|jgi:amino acid adenylation domain-containing protein